MVEVEAKKESTFKLKRKEKFSYALGDMASNIVYQGLALLILFYWTEKAGISAAAGGMILLISRLLDGFTDVVFGSLVDRTKSKHGKARPYLLWLSIPLALALTMTFWSPESSNNIINIIYAFISYNLTMTLYTAINIPYGVLSAKMTDDQYDRGILSILRGAAAMIAGIAISLIAPILSDAIGYTITFLILGLIGAILFYITFKGTKERVGSDAESENVPFKVGIKSLFKNRPWIIMLIGGCVLFTSFTARTAATAYFAQYYLGDTNLIGVLTMVTMPGAIIGMVVAAPLYKKIGKIKACIYTNILIAVISVPYYLVITNTRSIGAIVSYLLISGLIMGIAQGGMFAMITDTIEYGEWKTGIRIEGLTYSAASVGAKVGSGIGAAIVGLFLGFAGYNVSLEVQPDSVIIMTEWLYLWIPVIGNLIFAILMMFNDVDKKYPQILEELKRRKGE